MATLQELIAASLAANPNASRGGYEGVGTTAFPGPDGQTSYGTGGDPMAPQYTPQYEPQFAPDAAPSGPLDTILGQRPGYTPDYQALLGSDPQLQQAQADARAKLAASAAARKAATAKILAQLGITPDFGQALNGLGLDQSYLGSDVDPTVQGLAQTMTQQGLSTTAQLGRQHTASVNSLIDLLASRGSLRSGGLGSGLAVENQRDKQSQFDALQAALANIGAAHTDYNQTVQGTAGDLQTAGSDAIARQIQLHPVVRGDSVDAHYDPETGLYKDSFGAFYNPDGTPTKPGDPGAKPVHPSNVAPVVAPAPVVPPVVPNATIPDAPPPDSVGGNADQGGQYPSAAPAPVPTAAPFGGGGAPVFLPGATPILAQQQDAVQQQQAAGALNKINAGIPGLRGAGDMLPFASPTVQTAPSAAPDSLVGNSQYGGQYTPPPAPKTAWSNSVTKRLNMGF